MFKKFDINDLITYLFIYFFDEKDNFHWEKWKNRRAYNKTKPTEKGAPSTRRDSNKA